MTETTDISVSFDPTGSGQSVDYQAQLGAAAYSRVEASVRRRMNAAHAHFNGIMDTVELSAPGRFLAWLTLPLGAPLAPFCGRDVPVEVKVTPVTGGGTAWRRRYAFPGRAPFDVVSVKRLNASGLLVECMGSWLQMELALSEQHGALVFDSIAYRLTVAGFAFKLPPLLNPGRTRVVQRALHDGRFRFELTIDHPLLGRLVTQGGDFSERSTSV